MGQAGIALVEVLVALFAMGSGLLALLTLFPLGVLEMARAIEDDRTAALAGDAITLSEAAGELFSRTAEFVAVSLSGGTADPCTAARLLEDYEHLALQTEDLEARLEELRQDFPFRANRSNHIWVRYWRRFARIELRTIPIIQVLSLFEKG